MDNLALAAVALALVCFALVSERAQRGMLTPPMAFVMFGLAAHWSGILTLALKGPVVYPLAEIALVMVLFIDAARIDLRRLFAEHDLPVRMLLIGMPLSIIFGTVIAWGLFPELGLAGAALLAVILAPTDAALGQATVTSPELPVRVRQTLNVESGLNDGMALPLVVLFLSIVHAEFARTAEMPWPVFLVKQLTLGPLIGLAVGLVGGKAMTWACARGWIAGSFEGLAAIGLAVLAFAGAGLVDGNGFIAAFTAGLVFGHVARSVGHFLIKFGEAEGQLLVLGIFVIFGAAMLPATMDRFDWRIGLFAILALTLIRFAAVRLSLAGCGLHRATVWFLGWFGPRGLASVVFGLLVAEQEGLEIAGLITSAVAATVLLSVFAHGMSAAPLARIYGRTSAGQRDAFREEHKEVTDLPTRYRLPGPVDSEGNPG